jgi:hypothetical protein
VFHETNLLSPLSFYKNLNYKVAANIARDEGGLAEGKEVLSQYRDGSGISL